MKLSNRTYLVGAAVIVTLALGTGIGSLWPFAIFLLCPLMMMWMMGSMMGTRSRKHEADRSDASKPSRHGSGPGM